MRLVKDILWISAILQGSAKLSFSDWRRGILEIDEDLISDSLLSQLRGALPPEDVLNKLKEKGADYDKMPEGEQFAFEMAKIKRLPTRLKLICFKLRFDEYVSDIKPGNSGSYGGM